MRHEVMWTSVVVAILGACLLTSGNLAGEANQTASASRLVATASEPAQRPKWRIGFSSPTLEDPWRQIQDEEMRRAARKDPDIKLDVLNGRNRNDRQIQTVRRLLGRGIDLLIISPREVDALTAIVKEAYEKIPVIVIDRDINEPAYTCLIGGSNRKIGEAAGKRVAEHFAGRPAKIVEIEGIPYATATMQRKLGFEKVIAEHDNLEIIYDQPADYKREPAQEVMAAALQAHQQIDCVYAHNDEMALGAYQAAKEAGREGEMIIIGIDAVQTEVIKAVIDGNLYATYSYPTCGKEAIETALKILNGEDVPKEIELETTEITQENAADFYDPSSELVIME